ncbi:MAG TPA: hypothetical protein H9805_06385 [Candidatus Janibacter merdipullorum]|nr:hypothetical protein [Candidatus Janibacter merdipullorum]
MTHLASHWRERLLAVLSVTGLLLAASIVAPPQSEASICKQFGYGAMCRITFGGEKSGGGGDGGDDGGESSRPPCHQGGPEYEPVPCDNDGGGTWSNERQCYVLPSEPQPDPKTPGYRPDGTYYDCLGINEDGETEQREPFWASEPPRSPIGGNLQEDLETAVGVDFLAMYPGIAPTPIPPNTDWEGQRMSTLGAWTWMWPREPLGGMFEPPRVEEPERGYYVEAKVKKLEWDMGDGKGLVTCQGIAEPYQPYMKGQTPGCGYKYDEPGSYMVKVRTTWTVDYKDESGENSIDIELPHRSVIVRVGENQVVNK